MALHPIFQEITDAHRGLSHIGEGMSEVIVGLDRVMAKKAGKSVIQNIADTHGWRAPEESSERYRMLDAALAARGAPYRYGGGEGAHDAWSLARSAAIYATERDGIDVIREGSGDGNISEQAARMAITQWGLTEVRTRHAAPGDLLLFENDGGDNAKGTHVAILSSAGGELSWAMLPGKSRPEPKMIHAYRARSVIESWVGTVWMDRLIGAFSFDAPDAPRRAALKVAA